MATQLTMEADQPAWPTISGQAAERRSSRLVSPLLRTPRAYKICDTLTEAGIYASIVFAPWAFGTTSRGIIWALAIMGYFFGGPLLAKRVSRWRTGYFAWDPMVKSMEKIFVDNLSNRTEIYANATKSR